MLNYKKNTTEILKKIVKTTILGYYKQSCWHTVSSLIIINLMSEDLADKIERSLKKVLLLLLWRGSDLRLLQGYNNSKIIQSLAQILHLTPFKGPIYIVDDNRCPGFFLPLCTCFSKSLIWLAFLEAEKSEELAGARSATHWSKTQKLFKNF